MIYLDYAANTPASEKVIKTFAEIEARFPMNPNSSNPLAKEAKEMLNEAKEMIGECLNVKPNELVFTSTGTESNNLAIKGIAAQYGARKKHIITTYLEHSSVHGPIGDLQKQGYEVDYVDLDSDGRVDRDQLLDLLREDTLLVAVCHVDSENGVEQDIDGLGFFIKEESNAYFHVDGTQAVGKIGFDLRYVDTYTFAAHKFYGLNGSAGLVVKEGIIIEPLHHGGLSISPFRSGTPSLSLIYTMALAMKEMEVNKWTQYAYVGELNKELAQFFKDFDQIMINGTIKSVDYILNISLKGIKCEEVKNKLAKEGIYLSTKSACSAKNAVSRSVFALTKDRKRSRNTLRISLSHLTSMEDIKTFEEVFGRIIKSYE